jgi:hypothetical protein
MKKPTKHPKRMARKPKKRKQPSSSTGSQRRANSLKAGDWCFGVLCAKCAKGVGMFEDPSQGQTPLTFDGPGRLRVKCPGCGFEGEYQATQVQRLQAVYMH